MPPPLRVLRVLFYTGLITLSSLTVLVALNNTWPLKHTGHGSSKLDYLEAALGVRDTVHSVILDAGSTGSRVLAFTFLRSWTDNGLKLTDELWHEVKPGLSSFADNPKQGAESLLPLLELARQRIPKQYHAKTPLVLKATAGLRLLPQEKADALLYEVKQVLLKSGFHITDKSVGIMDGRDEGIFSWFTVNYLMDRITGDNADSLVALDLGGGSTQITFSPSQQSTLKETPQQYLTQISLFRKNIDLYTHSYLGLGLMAARKAILSQHMDADGVVRSPCVNPIINNYKWTYGDTTYSINGPKVPKYQDVRGQAGRLSEKRPIADHTQCVKTSVKVIGDKVHKPAELQSREVIAFSYFFDRATERGMIDPYKGGVVTVQELLQASVQACSIPNAEQPLACLDLVYISTFLTSGYGLKGSTKINLYKKIDNYEVSWALGLAFHIINNGI